MLLVAIHAGRCSGKHVYIIQFKVISIRSIRSIVPGHINVNRGSIIERLNAFKRHHVYIITWTKQ